ncbi:hypothetical protein BH23VER1_BH23VER1_35940 [soil metagenome]
MRVQSSVVLPCGVPVVMAQHSPRPDDLAKPHFGSAKRGICVVTGRSLSAE